MGVFNQNGIGEREMFRGEQRNGKGIEGKEDDNEGGWKESWKWRGGGRSEKI